MTSSVTINRLRTGVRGLDSVLGGGLPELSFNIIAGPPGSGKTTLAHQMMFAMVSPEKPALYVTVLGEPPLKMLRYQQQFTFFDPALVNASVHFLNLAEEALSGDLDAVLQRISAVVAERRPGFVFVDSFRSVVQASEGGNGAPTRLQKFVQELGVLMTSWQATTFLIGEYLADADANPVFTVADGIVWMTQRVQRNSVVRKLEVRKMRGQPTLPGLHPFRIGVGGIAVYPPAVIEPHVAIRPSTVTPESRLHMGVPSLDEMMGGGLPRGYSLLVAGPSGSGKSLLAAAFLAEGARAGERGVIVPFEQHPNRSRSPLVTELVESGAVALVDSRAPDLSIEEVVGLLQDDIRTLGATRVVIDSLSGFELALAPSFQEDFRESLARMVTALASTGVTVLMTSELEDRYIDLRFSPYGTAFLTDAIIVQRYIEIDSQLRRVMAVVKLRASMHSNELREYTIDADGIRIGTMLADHDGLLGGRPALKLARPPTVSHDARPA